MVHILFHCFLFRQIFLLIFRTLVHYLFKLFSFPGPLASLNNEAGSYTRSLYCVGSHVAAFLAILLTCKGKYYLAQKKNKQTNEQKKKLYQTDRLSFEYPVQDNNLEVVIWFCLHFQIDWTFSRDVFLVNDFLCNQDETLTSTRCNLWDRKTPKSKQ